MYGHPINGSTVELGCVTVNKCIKFGAVTGNREWSKARATNAFVEISSNSKHCIPNDLSFQSSWRKAPEKPVFGIDFGCSRTRCTRLPVSATREDQPVHFLNAPCFSIAIVSLKGGSQPVEQFWVTRWLARIAKVIRCRNQACTKMPLRLQKS